MPPVIKRFGRPSLVNRTSWSNGKAHAAAIPPVTATCGSLQYAATALFSDGSTKNVSSTATWTSSSSSVATINSSGLATRVGLGTTNIGASFSGVAATSEPLAVDQLNSITLNPATANIAVGASQSFLAIGNFTFAAGGSGNLDVSSQVTWNSSNTAVATIDTSGNNVLTDPTGKYLYVLDSTTTATPPSQVFAFNLNPATGVIGSQIGTPQGTGTGPMGMAIDSTGALLAVDNNIDYTISLYTFSTSTGALTPASPATAKTDSIPQFVTFYTAASDQ